MLWINFNEKFEWSIKFPLNHFEYDLGDQSLEIWKLSEELKSSLEEVGRLRKQLSQVWLIQKNGDFFHKKNQILMLGKIYEHESFW